MEEKGRIYDEEINTDNLHDALIGDIEATSSEQSKESHSV